MKFIVFLVSMAILSGCQSESKTKQIVQAALKDPKIMREAIMANPEAVITALNEASQVVKKSQAMAQKEKMAQDQMKFIDNPLAPKIRSDELIRGNKCAPITIVEYSDFECPYCARGFQTVKSLLERYPNQLKFVYKHLPLSSHPNAQISAQFYEAIRLQSEEQAMAFHDKLFQEPQLLKKGESGLTKVAHTLKLNMKLLKKDLHSKKVLNRINEDLKEAQEFGFEGTPGFLVEGVPVKGAYPEQYFVELIQKIKENKKLDESC